MYDPGQNGLEGIRGIHSALIKTVQRDLRVQHSALREQVVKAVAETNLGLAVTILRGAKSAEVQQLSPEEAYAQGAYTILGALMTHNNIKELAKLINPPKPIAAQHIKLLAQTTRFSDDRSDGAVSVPPAT